MRSHTDCVQARRYARRRSSGHSVSPFRRYSKRLPCSLLLTGAVTTLTTPPPRPAEFGPIVIRLEAELLHGVRIRQNIGDFGVRILVDTAIEHECSRVAATATGGDQFSLLFQGV